MAPTRDDQLISVPVLDEYYRRLLRYGTVKWSASNDDQHAYFLRYQLALRASRDGLAVELRWDHIDDVAFRGEVYLLRPDGSSYWVAPLYRVWRTVKYDTTLTSLRKYIEQDWGETLRTARRRAGVK